MATVLVKKVSGFADGIEVSEYKLCSGAGVSEYVFVNAQVIISFEMNGKQESIVYQNGHGYRSNDYNCPSNLFQVYHNNGDWLQKIEDLHVDLEKEDQDDLQDIVNASNGILKKISEIDFLRDFINENRPTLSDIGESSDVDDYDITNDEDGYPVAIPLKDFYNAQTDNVCAKLDIIASNEYGLPFFDLELAQEQKAVLEAAKILDKKRYMNLETGVVDSYDGWFYVNEYGEHVNAVELGEVVEVVQTNGEWVEV